MSKIEIIYEDRDVLVVNKPAGLIVHPASVQGGPDGKTKEQTVADWMLERYPQTADVGELFVVASGKKIARPGIVHRLDRETSGVLVLAKNQHSFEYLKKQFQNREIKKVYNTFVYGEMKYAEGVIDRPIGKSRKDFRLWSSQRGARGELREAVTHYKVLEKTKDFSFVEIRPVTGRTHQIRVHLKAINHPVVCDKLYAPKRECELGFSRLALHARTLTFRTSANSIITAEAPLPDDFQKALGLFS